MTKAPAWIAPCQFCGEDKQVRFHDMMFENLNWQIDPRTEKVYRTETGEPSGQDDPRNSDHGVACDICGASAPLRIWNSHYAYAVRLRRRVLAAAAEYDADGKWLGPLAESLSPATITNLREIAADIHHPLARHALVELETRGASFGPALARKREVMARIEEAAAAIYRFVGYRGANKTAIAARAGFLSTEIEKHYPDGLEELWTVVTGEMIPGTEPWSGKAEAESQAVAA